MVRCDALLIHVRLGNCLWCLGQISYVHSTPKQGLALEQTNEVARNHANSTLDGSPGPGSSRTRPPHVLGNPSRSAGTEEHSVGPQGSVGAVSDDVPGTDHPRPYYNSQTGPSFDQAEPTPYFPSDPPTVRSEDVALLQSLIKSPFPHPREKYSLGPLKGLPEQCSDESYTELEEACLIRHFTENLASWVSLSISTLPADQFLALTLPSLILAIETGISSRMSHNEQFSVLSCDMPSSQRQLVI